MGKPQIIYHDGEPAFAVIPWKDYVDLSGDSEAGLSDEELYDRAKEDDEESFVGLMEQGREYLADRQQRRDPV